MFISEFTLFLWNPEFSFFIGSHNRWWIFLRIFAFYEFSKPKKFQIHAKFWKDNFENLSFYVNWYVHAYDDMCKFDLVKFNEIWLSFPNGENSNKICLSLSRWPPSLPLTYHPDHCSGYSWIFLTSHGLYIMRYEIVYQCRIFWSRLS